MRQRDDVPARVAAGFPSPGAEWREPQLNLRRLLGFVSEDSFCYFMRSTALSVAGVMRGDILVVSPTLTASNRDLVIARVNGAVWVRRLLLAGGVRFLVPEDLLDAHQPRFTVFAHERLQLVGVILCSIHPLHAAARERVAPFQQTRDLDAFLGLDQPGVYCTRVVGTSMRAVGIADGDILLIDRRLSAQENDIVIASLDGAFVVKRLIQARGAVFLLSDNPLTPPIAVTSQQFQVWGVVLFNLHLVHPLITHRLLEEEGR